MSDTTYTLYYWSSIPGRGEYIRLAFEAAGTSFMDNTDPGALQARVMSTGAAGHPPHFAPPVLGVTPSGGSEWFMSQTPAILAFLGPRLRLVGDVDGEDTSTREQRRAHVQQLTLTALDLMLEAHDSHHPIGSGLYCG
jgi:glutathione S-transferase